MVNTKRTTFSATALVLVSGVVLAFGTTTLASNLQETVAVSLQEVDTDQNGCLSEEEYNEAVKKSRQQWENQYGFTKETPSSQVEDVAPPGTAAPMKAPKAHPQEFEKEMPSSQE